MTDQAKQTAAVTLERWQHAQVTYEGETKDVYKQGSGPGVVVIHEIPGITPAVAAFGQEVVDAGYTVWMPSLVGTPGRAISRGYTMASVLRVCISREFATWATGRTSPVTAWCRALAADLHRETGGPGVGAVGMCFSGGFALAMMVDDTIAAPVLSQPSLPFAIGRSRSANLGLDATDLARVRERVVDGCAVLGLRYRGDKLVGTRFATLHDELGAGFVAVEFDGGEHSVLTEDRQQHGVDEVLAFFAGRLHAPG